MDTACDMHCGYLGAMARASCKAVHEVLTTCVYITAREEARGEGRLAFSSWGNAGFWKIIDPGQLGLTDANENGARQCKRCKRAALQDLATMAALSQLIPAGLYSPDRFSSTLLSATSGFAAQTERDAAAPTAFSLAESSLAQKFGMSTQLNNMPFIPAPAEKKKIKLYSRDFYAVSRSCMPEQHLVDPYCR